MMKPIRISPIFKAPNENSKTAQIIQPKARKSLVLFNQPANVLSPTKNSSNAEIIHPILTSKSMGSISSRESAPSIKIKASLSDPNFKPLDSLSPTKPKKTRHSKRYRNSCSADISWSPDFVEKVDEIRPKRFSDYEDETQYNENHLIFEQINCIHTDNQASPLMNINVDA